MTRAVVILSLCLAAAVLVAVKARWQLHCLQEEQEAAADAPFFLRADPVLQLAESREAPPEALRRLAEAAAKSTGAPNLKAFEQKHKAHPLDVLTGAGTFPELRSAAGALVHPVLDFTVSAIVLQQDHGSAQTAQLALQEVDGNGKPIGHAVLKTLNFNYAPCPAAPERRLNLWLGIGAEVSPTGLSAPVYALGASYRAIGWLTFGGAVMVEQPLLHVSLEAPQMRVTVLATVGLQP